MEQLLAGLPSTPIGWIALVTAGVVVLLSLLNKQRTTDMRTLRDTNDDLRNAIEDKGIEIAKLRDDVRELREELAILQASNTTMQEIVNAALKEYFSENPQVVVQLSKTIKVRP